MDDYVYRRKFVGKWDEERRSVIAVDVRSCDPVEIIPRFDKHGL